MHFDIWPPHNPDDNTRFQQPIWRDRKVTYQAGDDQQGSGWKYDQWERVFNISGVSADAIFQQARARLISMDIVPPALLEFTAQWNTQSRLPQVDDLIFQRTHLFQIGGRRLVDLHSATRIGDVIDEPNRFELQYIATEGHPERGFSRYTIAQGNDVVMFTIRTTSQPANILTKLANPIITRRMQLRVTNSILDYMVTTVTLDLTGG